MEKVANSSQWSECLRYISGRVKQQTFNTWLKPTRGEMTPNGAFKLAVPNQFVADWINDHFREVIDEAFEEVLGNRYELIYVIAPSDTEDQLPLPLEVALHGNGHANGNGYGNGHSNGHDGSNGHSPLTAYTTNGNGTTGAAQNLSKRYSFETLVVGDFNSFACAAARAVAEAPGMTRYNPLFIYGGTGLGKTHIVSAIGNEISTTFRNKRIMYATSEKFTSDFITAISERAIADFTKVYRDVDVLIIDDIQFFTGKEGTQEQFFHTFNSLYHAGKQIVLTSDRPPKEIKGLEDRLLSRFSWGLVTDLQAPDLENRTAILYKKVSSEGQSLPDSVIRFIADIITTNVRELEGALTRLLAYASLKKVPVDLEMARKILADTGSGAKRDVTIEAIQKKTSEYYSIPAAMMTAKKKTAKIALARQVAMYLSRSLTDNSLKQIGSTFGGRDHSTVIHACELISRRMSADPALREKIDKISASLLY